MLFSLVDDILSPSCLGLTTYGPLAHSLWPLLPSERSSWRLVSPEPSVTGHTPENVHSPLIPEEGKPT